MSNSPSPDETEVGSNPLILTVETATPAGSISLTRGAAVLASSGGDFRTSHSNTLLADIDTILSRGNTSLTDIDIFAVAVGPGSFTGLRIGIATIKALAATLNRPCAGVSTLQAIAHAGGFSDASVALLPAGRGEVFAQLFMVSSTGVVTPIDEAAHISPQKLLEKYGALDDVYWCGPGAQAQRQFINDWATRTGRQLLTDADGAFGNNTRRGWKMAPAVANLAEHVAFLAFANARRYQLDTSSSLRASYVRPSDAELNQS